MRAARIARISAILVIAGIVLSGPLAVALVNITHPQPAWDGAARFAESYHPIQSAPYLGGIFLVCALVMLIASLHAIADEKLRPRTLAAPIFTAIFATMIFSNYVVQSTFLPALAHPYDAANASIISALSMSNPTSLAWAMEMWRWAFLGIATWLVAPVLADRKTKWTFIANGPVSIAGGLITTLKPGWVMTSSGLVLFSLWNILLLAMAVLAFISLRKKSSEPGRRTGSERNAISEVRRDENLVDHVNDTVAVR